MSVDDSGKATAKPEEWTITLRDEDRLNGSHLSLWAYLDAEGRLHLDGQDLGPVTASVSGDGEYEYFKTIAAKDIPRLLELLGGNPGDNILEVLEKGWTGKKSYDLERLLRDSDIRVRLTTWSG